MELRPMYSPSGTDTSLQKIRESANIFNRSRQDWYNKFSRYGIVDPYNGLTTTREYLFFTRPDLNLAQIGRPDVLQPQLANIPFFNDILNRYPNIIKQLQKSSVGVKASGYNPFMQIMTNATRSTLDLPTVEANFIDNNKTIYGSSIDYRGDGFSADEDHTFTIEMDDTKYLDVYMMLKTYEEYERLKKIGRICPPNIDSVSSSVNDAYGNPVAYSYYIRKRILHDQFAIFKFIVDDDMESLVYWAHLKGVTFTNVPREIFSENLTGDLRYTVGFKAQFVDDMNPDTLIAFNKLIRDEMPSSSSITNIENGNDPHILTQAYNYDASYNASANLNIWPGLPYIYKMNNTNNPDTWLAPTSMKHKYQLKWRIN